MTDVVVYHSADLDGICSAAIARMAIADETRVRPLTYGMDYNEEWPDGLEKHTGRIYMLDFSLQPFELMAALEQRRGVIWIDHHKSALEAMQQSGLQFAGIQRIGLGACALTWEYFYPDAPMPPAVLHLAHYDVWKHASPLTVAFNLGLRAHVDGPISSIWDTLLQSDEDAYAVFMQIAREGQIIDRSFRAANAATAAACAFETEVAGLPAIAINHPFAGSRLLASRYDATRHKLMVVYGYTGKDWKVSLYTDRADVDCAAIAVANGGGGHKTAAGYHCEAPPFYGKAWTGVA